MGEDGALCTNEINILNFSAIEDQKEGMKKLWSKDYNFPIEESEMINSPRDRQVWLKDQVIEKVESRNLENNERILNFDSKSQIVLLKDNKSIDDLNLQFSENEKYIFEVTPIYENEQSEIDNIKNTVDKIQPDDEAVRLQEDANIIKGIFLLILHFWTLKFYRRGIWAPE